MPTVRIRLYYTRVSAILSSPGFLPNKYSINSTHLYCRWQNALYSMPKRRIKIKFWYPHDNGLMRRITFSLFYIPIIRKFTPSPTTWPVFKMGSHLILCQNLAAVIKRLWGKKCFTRVLNVLGVGILEIESSNVLVKRIAVYKDNIAHKLRFLVRLLA